MMACGQVGALSAFASLANSLTHDGQHRVDDSPMLSPLFTACGLAIPAVDRLCPNRRANLGQRE